MDSRRKAWGPADIDCQQRCPFYDGRFPREITDLIFEFALSPDVFLYPPARLDPGHDFCVQYDHERGHDEPDREPVAHQAEAAVATTAVDSVTDNTAAVNSTSFLAMLQNSIFHSISRTPQVGFDWFRPDNTGKTVFHGLGLLQTCRRVYLDTNELLEQARDIELFEGRDPPSLEAFGFQPWARRLAAHFHRRFPQIRSVRLYAQMHRLERLLNQFEPSRSARAIADPVGHQFLVSKLSQGLPPAEPVWRILYHLENFHLTLRRTDWFRWEDNRALAFNPYRRGGAPSLELMRQDMHTTMVEGRLPPCDDSPAFITFFRAMRNLKTMKISFETSEDKKEEMEEIVAWAKTWRFDIMSWRHWVGERVDERVAYLVAEDKPVGKMSWRGFPYHWSDFCTACASEDPKPGCAYCLRKQRLLEQGKGPRLLVWTVTWRPELVDTPVDSEVNELGNAQGGTGSQQ